MKPLSPRSSPVVSHVSFFWITCFLWFLSVGFLRLASFCWRCFCSFLLLCFLFLIHTGSNYHTHLGSPRCTLQQNRGCFPLAVLFRFVFALVVVVVVVVVLVVFVVVLVVAFVVVVVVVGT